MYSLFVRGNIGSQFHKVEHRLESLISSRVLVFFFMADLLHLLC